MRHAKMKYCDHRSKTRFWARYPGSLLLRRPFRPIPCPPIRPIRFGRRARQHEHCRGRQHFLARARLDWITDGINLLGDAPDDQGFILTGIEFEKNNVSIAVTGGRGQIRLKMINVIYVRSRPYTAMHWNALATEGLYIFVT